MAKGISTWVGGSFHNVTITASINDIISVLGKPNVFDNSGEDKVNVDWNAETNSGFRFTVYDWKEYRVLDLDEPIRFHIGSVGGAIQEWEAVDELEKDIHRVKRENDLLKSGLEPGVFDALTELNDIEDETN